MMMGSVGIIICKSAVKRRLMDFHTGWVPMKTTAAELS